MVISYVLIMIYRVLTLPLFHQHWKTNNPNAFLHQMLHLKDDFLHLPPLHLNLQQNRHGFVTGIIHHRSILVSCSRLVLQDYPWDMGRSLTLFNILLLVSPGPLAFTRTCCCYTFTAIAVLWEGTKKFLPFKRTENYSKHWFWVCNAHESGKNLLDSSKKKHYFKRCRVLKITGWYSQSLWLQYLLPSTCTSDCCWIGPVSAWRSL